MADAKPLISLWCQHCQKDFPSRAIASTGAVRLTNVTVIQACPSCGRDVTAHFEDVILGSMIRVLSETPDALTLARQAMAEIEKLKRTPDLKRAKRSGVLKRMKGLIPTKPEHLDIYSKVLGRLIVAMTIFAAGGTVNWKGVDLGALLGNSSHSQTARTADGPGHGRKAASTTPPPLKSPRGSKLNRRPSHK